MTTPPAHYFKHYRKALGFTNQRDAKLFLSGKDIHPGIDWEYLKSMIGRIHEIVEKTHTIASNAEYAPTNDINAFLSSHVDRPFDVIKKNGLIDKLNNQGRRPEQVLFSWLRGYATAAYFIPVVSEILESDTPPKLIGDDDLNKPETFRRTPTADFLLTKNKRNTRIELQSGFQGINDIKEHKVREAHRVLHEYGEHTVCVHIDLFNGQVAFVQLDKIKTNDPNFVTRQQMEGQSVLTIDQNYFKWRLLDKPPTLYDLELEIY